MKGLRKVLSALLAAACLASCGQPKVAAGNDPSEREDATTTYRAGTSSEPKFPPQLQAAVDRLKARDAAQDEAASKVRARDHQWSGVALTPNTGPLQKGDDLTSAERDYLASECEKVARTAVDTSRIKVDKGPPSPRVTCMLASGRPITIRIDEDGKGHRAR